MRAKVKDDYRWRSVKLCAGTEFIKGTYSDVPAGFEAEAKRSGMLEFEPEPKPEPIEIVIDPEIHGEDEQPKRGRRKAEG